MARHEFGVMENPPSPGKHSDEYELNFFIEEQKSRDRGFFYYQTGTP